MAEPEIATGTMYVARDGKLVRDQETPERQITEIGERMLSTRTSPEAEPTLYPIPGEARPMLLALRRMLAGDGAGIVADFTTDLSVRAEGWVLVLRPRDDPDVPALTFTGCGNALHAVEIAGRDRVVRTITFSAPR